jgi:hypothetical protein
VVPCSHGEWLLSCWCITQWLESRLRSLGNKTANTQLDQVKEVEGVRAQDHDMLNLGALPPIRNAPRPEARQKLSRAFDFILLCIVCTDLEDLFALWQCVNAANISKASSIDDLEILPSRSNFIAASVHEWKILCVNDVLMDDGSPLSQGSSNVEFVSVVRWSKALVVVKSSVFCR